MARYRKRIKWKSLLTAGLALLLCVGAIVGISSMTAKETTSISALAFKVGAIGENGNYVKSETSIYTKDMFECQGLTIEPDFEATGTYQVFYYGEDKAFLAATEVLKTSEGAYVKGDEYPEAKYARIVITPEVPTDDNGEVVEDFKISSLDVMGYASDYTITVAKDQTFDTDEPAEQNAA